MCSAKFIKKSRVFVVAEIIDRGVIMENEPIRVLHIVPNMQAGGLETLIMNIYRNIDRTKIQFDFLVHYIGNYFYDDEIRKMGGIIYKLSVRDDNNFLKYLKDLDHFFKTHQEYKIVHGHMESLGQFYFKKAKNNHVPVRIAHSHNSATENTIKGWIKRILLKRFKIYATDFFACSQKAGEFMFANKKFTVLKNAIIVDNFVYNDEERNRLREELKIQNKMVIGHVGRFCEQKNHKFLIDIFRNIVEAEDNAVLLLIGTGETFVKIHKQVRAYGLEDCVIFLGVRKDIASLYQAMDCFVFPSLFEGLGIVAIEAQCSGLPVVGSDVIPKEAAVTNQFHYMSLDDSAEAWAKKIVDVTKQERKAEIGKIREEGYDVHDVAAYLQEFYIKKYLEN